MARMWVRAAASAVTLTFAVGGAAVATTPATAPQILDALGCFIGPVAADGDRFSAAVIRFQAANRLEQTGKLNDKTRDRLAGPDGKRCDDRRIPKNSGEGRRVVL